MSDKRVFPRIKKRLVVDFEVDGAPCTGFTHDLSYTGFFVVAGRLPKPGTSLEATLHMPDGKRLLLTGVVVRSRRVPPALTHTIPTGFSLQISGYSEAYTRFVESVK